MICVTSCILLLLHVDVDYCSGLSKQNLFCNGVNNFLQIVRIFGLDLIDISCPRLTPLMCSKSTCLVTQSKLCASGGLPGPPRPLLQAICGNQGIPAFYFDAAHPGKVFGRTSAKSPVTTITLASKLKRKSSARGTAANCLYSLTSPLCMRV